MAAALLQPDVLARAEALGLAAQQIVEGLRVGDHKSPYRGFSVEFVQHRVYVPGDDIRHIDWKSYGRSERYTIKQYEQETNFIAHLLCDVSNSMDYGDGPANKLNYAKLLAASLSYLIVKQRDSVGLRTFDAAWRVEVPPRSQFDHVAALCRTLEAHQPAAKTRIGPLLEELADCISRRGIIVLISDGLDDDAESLLKGLRHLRFRGHEVIFFQVLHRDEVEFPLDGNVRFVNLEGPDHLLTRPHLLRPAYVRLFGSFLQELVRGCDAGQIDYMRLITDRPLAAALSEYLIRRRLRGRR